MTREEIILAEPGPQLNALIAENVFNYQVIWINTKIGFYPYIRDHTAKKITANFTDSLIIGGRWVQGITPTGEMVEIFGCPVPTYSEDISATWEVEMEMNTRGWKIHLHRFGEGFSCYFHHPLKMKTTSSGFFKTAPGAICKASLMAVFEIIARLEENEAAPFL